MGPITGGDVLQMMYTIHSLMSAETCIQNFAMHDNFSNRLPKHCSIGRTNTRQHSHA